MWGGCLWGEKISIRLGFFIRGVEFSDAPLPREFGLVKVTRAMVQLEYDKCFHF